MTEPRDRWIVTTGVLTGDRHLLNDGESSQERVERRWCHKVLTS